MVDLQVLHTAGQHFVAFVYDAHPFVHRKAIGQTSDAHEFPVIRLVSILSGNLFSVPVVSESVELSFVG